jgi:hypothetical protein
MWKHPPHIFHWSEPPKARRNCRCPYSPPTSTTHLLFRHPFVFSKTKAGPNIRCSSSIAWTTSSLFAGSSPTHTHTHRQANWRLNWWRETDFSRIKHAAFIPLAFICNHAHQQPHHAYVRAALFRAKSILHTQRVIYTGPDQQMPIAHFIIREKNTKWLPEAHPRWEAEVSGCITPTPHPNRNRDLISSGRGGGIHKCRWLITNN